MRWRLLALSTLSVAWLVAMFGAALARERDFWPVMEASLFSWETDELVAPRLVGTTREGRVLDMTAGGFGLQPQQLEHWLGERLGSRPQRARQGNGTLQLLARIWNRRQPDDKEVVAVELRLRRTLLPVGSGASEQTLLTWRAPSSWSPP